MESEYIACSAAVQEAVWLRRFLQRLSVSAHLDDAVLIHCDSTVALAFAKDPNAADEFIMSSVHAMEPSNSVLVLCTTGRNTKANFGTVEYSENDTYTLRIDRSFTYDRFNLIDYLFESKIVNMFIYKEDVFMHGLSQMASTSSEEVSHRDGIVQRSSIMLIIVQRSSIMVRSDQVNRMPSFWSNMLEGDGQIFDRAVDFKKSVANYAIAHKFGYRMKRSDPNMVKAVCGLHSCGWYVCASIIRNTGYFQVYKSNLQHSHPAGYSTQQKTKVPKTLIADVILDKLRDNPKYHPVEVVRDISREYGASYHTNKHGDVESWPQVCCRRLLVLDGTFMTSKYKCTLLVASAYDADAGMLPVAFGVVPFESIDNWEWYLTQLIHALQYEVGDEFVFISDQHIGIVQGLQHIFPSCSHAHCLRYLKENIKKYLKGRYSQSYKAAIEAQLDKITYSRKMRDYEKNMEVMHRMNRSAHQWVIQAQPEIWVIALFKGN
ncbi:uncharacterized protein LOC122662913 [Telopea speciosissima]|uniref:uncharacterized protein LOC122662913 n=1 Tax=Telopea speciosissima TaxID=54955 RepID=UPI001CC3D643|nr:uncharacterized protein LOC122662913 [Telopea speciosissima]